MRRVFKQDDVKFDYETDTWTIAGITNLSSSPVDVFIPKTFAGGWEVRVIGSSVFSGSFRKVVVDDSIEHIFWGAFKNSNVKEVVWPSSCKTIPICCFQNSKIEHIQNIGHVELISSMAFRNSSIKHIDWPDNCFLISPSCFSGSFIETVSNIEHIESIGTLAFCNCYNLQLLDLSKTLFCSIGNDAFRGIDPKKIIFPYYIFDSDVSELF